MTEQIRFASAADAEALLAIYAPYVENTTITYEYDVPSVEEFRGRIESITKKYPYLVYVRDSEIVGYAYANTFRTRAAFQWDVETSIYIKDGLSRSGIGRKLYEALLLLVKAQGYYQAYAYISVPNEKSTRFHEALGFQEIAFYEHTGYKLGTWCSLSCMLLPLHPIHGNAAPSLPVSVHDLDKDFIQRVLSGTSTYSCMTKEEVRP